MIQSLVNILNGDYENTNPLMKKLFFMIAELFGGKSRLSDLFPKMKDKINDFYAKEFKLIPEKRSAISSVCSDYELTDKDFTKKNPPEFEKNFTDKDNVLFSADGLQASLIKKLGGTEKAFGAKSVRR